MTPTPSNSYSRGAHDVPLLRETIGESLRRVAERFPEREALVVRHQAYRATYAELCPDAIQGTYGLTNAQTLEDVIVDREIQDGLCTP